MGSLSSSEESIVCRPLAIRIRWITQSADVIDCVIHLMRRWRVWEDHRPRWHSHVDSRADGHATRGCLRASTTPARVGPCSPRRRHRASTSPTGRCRSAGLVEHAIRLSWDEMQALPASTYEGPIHCVTTWSKFDMSWVGVSVDTLIELAGPLPIASHVMATSHTGYTTNLPRRRPHRRQGVDRLGGRRPSAARGPRRSGAVVRPAPLLLEEREVGERPAVHGPRRAGLLGGQRLPRPG